MTIFSELQNYIANYALNLIKEEKRERLSEIRITYDYNKSIMAAIVATKRLKGEPERGVKIRYIQSPYGEIQVLHLYVGKYVIIQVSLFVDK